MCDNTHTKKNKQKKAARKSAPATGPPRVSKKKRKCITTNSQQQQHQQQQASGNVSAADSDSSEDNEEINVRELNTDASYESAFYAHYFQRPNDKNKKVEKEFQIDFSIAKTNVWQSHLETADAIAAAGDTQLWLAMHQSSKFDGKGGISKKDRPCYQLIFVLDISGRLHSFIL